MRDREHPVHFYFESVGRNGCKVKGEEAYAQASDLVRNLNDHAKYYLFRSFREMYDFTDDDFQLVRQ